MRENIPQKTTYVSANPENGTYNSDTSLWEVDTLASGKSSTLTITLRVGDAFSAGDSLINTVELIEENGTTPLSEVEGSNTVEVKEPALSLTKRASATEVRKGENITYTITLANNGTGAARDIQVKENLPKHTTVKKVEATIGSYDQSTALWNIPLLSAGETATLIIAVTIDESINTGEKIVNEVEIINENGTVLKESITSKAEVTVENLENEVLVSKKASNLRPNLGDEVTYTITIENLGDGEGAYYAYDNIPKEIEEVVISKTTSGKVGLENNRLFWEGSIGPKEKIEITYQGRVSARKAQIGKTYTNNVEVYDSNHTLVAYASEKITVSGGVPKTGDEGNVIPYVVITTLAMLMFMALWLVKKRINLKTE